MRNYFRSVLLSFSNTRCAEEFGTFFVQKGDTPEEIAKAKKNMVFYEAPYTYLAPQQSDLWKEERNAFHKLLQLERQNNPSVIHGHEKENIFTWLSLGAPGLGKRKSDDQWDTDEAYERYIEIVRADLEQCRECHVDCCSWCRHCKVIHFKAQCGNILWDAVKKEHSTWRRYFKTLSGHEAAVLRSFYHPIAGKIRGSHCPCYVVYRNTDYRKPFNVVAAIEGLRKFDKATLIRHLELINSLKAEKNSHEIVSS